MTITSRLLEAYLKCPTKCWLRSAGEQVTDSAYTQCAQAQNESYGAAEIHRLLLRADHSECMNSPSAEDLKAGKWRLATGVFAQTPHLESYVHAVERLPPEGRGNARFVAIRFIPDNKVSKDAKLLIAFDTLALSEMIGEDVSLGKIMHGGKHTAVNVSTSTLALQVREHIANIAALIRNSSPPDLILIRHCTECEFQTRCRQKALEKDDLSLLSGMTEKERKKLHDKGIFTVTQLSFTFRPRRRPKRLYGKRETYHHSLRALAIRQKKIHIVGSPEIAIEGTPVYLDVEGLPDRDFYYLIGVRIGNGDSAPQYSLWADSLDEERRIWNEFVGILTNVRDPVLIHYGSYETVFLKRMGDRYGLPTPDSMIARAVSKPVNLLSVIFAQVYFPTFSNRLKDIGSFLGAKWTGPVTSGFQSLAYRLEWEQSLAPELKAALVAYNRDDCAAIEIVASHLTQIIREAQSRADVEFSDKPKMVASDVGAEIHGSLESIVRSAHFTYARSRIKLSAVKATQPLPASGRFYRDYHATISRVRDDARFEIGARDAAPGVVHGSVQRGVGRRTALHADKPARKSRPAVEQSHEAFFDKYKHLEQAPTARPRLRTSPTIQPDQDARAARAANRRNATGRQSDKQENRSTDDLRDLVAKHRHNLFVQTGASRVPQHTRVPVAAWSNIGSRPDRTPTNADRRQDTSKKTSDLVMLSWRA